MRSFLVLLAALSAPVLVLASACSSDDTGGGATTNGTTTSGPGSGGAGPTTSSSAMGGSSTTSTGGSSTTNVGGAGGGSGGASGDTWNNYARGFFGTYCIECHGAGDALRDYTTIDDVKTEAAEIRCGVAPTVVSGCSGSPVPKQFPIDNAAGNNPKPTDDERNRIVAWIEAGTPE